jgi:membrane protein
VALSVWLVTVLPPQLDALGTLPDALRSVIAILRWPLLAAVLTASIRGLYSISAGYSATRPVTAGALAATLVWLAGSALFGVYTSNFSVLTERYGSISSIVVVLLWLYLGAFATLLGAEVDAVTVAHRTSSDEVQPEPLRSDPLVSERRRRGTTAQVPRH